jgi:hypothetical protein
MAADQCILSSLQSLVPGGRGRHEKTLQQNLLKLSQELPGQWLKS